VTAEYAPDTTVDDIMDALAAFILPFVPGGQIVRGQVSRVALPPDPFILLTEIGQYDIDVPHEYYQQEAGTATLIGPKRIDVQADFYGSVSGDYCNAVKTAFRTMWGIDQFPENIQPLYTSDARQIPLITGEEQYETRWMITLSLQYNPKIVVPQQFADMLTPEGLVPVDVFFK
jgi:hypothetical protein